MKGLCGADCPSCASYQTCPGCTETCGRPLGGRCLAAEYIRFGGRAAYDAFKAGLLDELNALLRELGFPEASALCELAGRDVNLAYPLPNGTTVKFLDDRNIYLGTQIAVPDIGVCYGAVADMGFLLVCSYSVDGSLPELVAYRRR